VTAYLLSRILPCQHQRVRFSGLGSIRRVCRTCKRRYVGTISPSAVSSHVGAEVLRVEWKELER
jgi:hypothetical protein